MAANKIDVTLSFPGSVFFANWVISTVPATVSAPVLNSIVGWDENPSSERMTYPKWNGRGVFVSNKQRVSTRQVELEFIVELSETLYRNMLVDLGRMAERTDIEMAVSRVGGTRKARHGFVSDSRDVRRFGNVTIVNLNITFADPYLYDTNFEDGRL